MSSNLKDDTYKTINAPSEETLFKDRNSKFFGYAFPVKTEKDIKERLLELKKVHPTAGHHCYAWQIGEEKKQFRINDDGEPNNSAGQPIYGQIQAFGVTNILIVSVRYFGGTKLGVGGLISAYRKSAQLALEASQVVDKTINVSFELKFEYEMMNKVQRIIKERNLIIITQTMEISCKFIIAVRKKHSAQIFDIFNNMFKIDIKKVN